MNNQRGFSRSFIADKAMQTNTALMFGSLRQNRALMGYPETFRGRPAKQRNKGELHCAYTLEAPEDCVNHEASRTGHCCPYSLEACPHDSHADVFRRRHTNTGGI